MVNQKSVKNKAVLLSWLIGIDNCLCLCHWVTFFQNSNDLDLIKLKVLRVLETLKKTNFAFVTMNTSLNLSLGDNHLPTVHCKELFNLHFRRNPTLALSLDIN